MQCADIHVVLCCGVPMIQQVQQGMLHALVSPFSLETKSLRTHIAGTHTILAVHNLKPATAHAYSLAQHEPNRTLLEQNKRKYYASVAPKEALY